MKKTAAALSVHGKMPPMDIQDIARRAAQKLIYIHPMKTDGVIMGTPVLYPGGERVIVYLSTDRPGLVFVSDFEGGRKRAMMEGVREAFDAAIATMAGDPPLISEGLSIYLRVPPSDVPDAIMRIANASAEALRSALGYQDRP